VNILVCTQEYYPKGSGIANVAHYVVEELKKKGHICTIMSSNTGDIPVNTEKLIKKISGFGLIYFWEKVRKYIKQNETTYDIIWVHNPLFLRKIYSSKIYSTVHTTYKGAYEFYKKEKRYSFFIRKYFYIMKIIEQICYKNTFKTNVISPAVKNELIQLGLKEENITYIPNGVSTEIFKPTTKRLKLDIPKDHKVILCVGRIAYQKNPYRLAQTIEEIKKLGGKVTLLWAGAGEIYEQYKKDVSHIKEIQMLGKVKHEELPKLYSIADAFVLASIYEGQPLTLLEALSQGCPCIVSTIPHMTHLIKESKSGLVVDFYKPKKAATEIITYLDSEKAKQDKIIARKYAINELDWSIIAKKYEKKWLKIMHK
jgi:glycosyltransferase involved in cell wall biosynthesis